jgi:hypothetical protein
MMRFSLFVAAAVVAIAASACDTATDPPANNPPSQTMTFKQGARYEYASSYRSATSGQDTNARMRTWTLVAANASVRARSNVAVYIDSVFTTAGGFVSVADSVLLQQQPGTNDIYRFSSILGELDVAVAVPFLGALDLGRAWQHEAKLGATVANWFVADVADTIANTFGIPVVTGFRVSITDSAVASTSESVTVAGTSYQTTKTTHSLRLSVNALATIAGIPISVPVGGTSLARTTWIAPSLGAIVREEREAKVLNIDYQGQGFSVPIPGYVSVMTRIIAGG